MMWVLDALYFGTFIDRRRIGSSKARKGIDLSCRAQTI
jgi:hypothetical protein